MSSSNINTNVNIVALRRGLRPEHFPGFVPEILNTMAAKTASGVVASGTYFLPTLLTVLGLSNFTNGVYTLMLPYQCARAFGLMPISLCLNREIADPTKNLRDLRSFSTFYAQMSLIRIYALRNLHWGFTTLGVTVYWIYADGVAKRTLAKCLGISMLAGGLVSWGDALIMNRFSDAMAYVAEHAGANGKNEEEEWTEARIVAREALTGHVLRGIAMAVTGIGMLWF